MDPQSPRRGMEGQPPALTGVDDFSLWLSAILLHLLLTSRTGLFLLLSQGSQWDLRQVRGVERRLQFCAPP